jgi:hypothetical protein
MSATPVRRPAGSVYGPIVTGATVERAALTTLRTHAHRYIAETCRQEGRDPLPDPRGYIVASTFDKWPEDQVPVVVVISPGWAARPRRAGGGRVLVPWTLAAGIVTTAKPERTRENAQLYVAAIRTLLAQQQSLGGLAEGVDCIDEDYLPPFAFSRTRTLLAVQATFVVTVPDAFTYGAGTTSWTPGHPDPPEPPDPTDPPNWPTVKSRPEIRLTLTDNPASEEE